MNREGAIRYLSRPRAERSGRVGVGWKTRAGLVLSVIVMSGIWAGTASATIHVYCNSLVNPFTACSAEAVGVYNFNHAEYDGAGTVNVCEHTYLLSNNSTVSRRCLNNIVGSSTDLDFYFAHGYDLILTCGNNSSNRHTIYCWGQY